MNLNNVEHAADLEEKSLTRSNDREANKSMLNSSVPIKKGKKKGEE